MSEAAPPQQIVALIVEWFGRTHGAGLKLPYGWFGRPFDNLHQLSGATADAAAVTLVLDHTQERRSRGRVQ